MLQVIGKKQPRARVYLGGTTSAKCTYLNKNWTATVTVILFCAYTTFFLPGLQSKSDLCDAAPDIHLLPHPCHVIEVEGMLVQTQTHTNIQSYTHAHRHKTYTQIHTNILTHSLLVSVYENALKKNGPMRNNTKQPEKSIPDNIALPAATQSQQHSREKKRPRLHRQRRYEAVSAAGRNSVPDSDFVTLPRKDISR